MYNRSKLFLPFFALFVFVIGVGCLCSGLGSAPPEAPAAKPPSLPTKPQAQQPVATDVPATDVATQPPSSNSGGLTTFVDENKLYQIDVPSDWKYEHNVVSQDFTYYTDTFTSPDGGAVIENIVYDDGKPFAGSQKGKWALKLLNKAYSKTGAEGDIKVTDDNIQKDGSERLTWTSKEGHYSGISFFEVRSNNTTFLMFTVDWGDAVKDQYFDTLNAVIASYSVP